MSTLWHLLLLTLALASTARAFEASDFALLRPGLAVQLVHEGPATPVEDLGPTSLALGYGASVCWERFEAEGILKLYRLPWSQQLEPALKVPLRSGEWAWPATAFVRANPRRGAVLLTARSDDGARVQVWEVTGYPVREGGVDPWIDVGRFEGKIGRGLELEARP